MSGQQRRGNATFTEHTTIKALAPYSFELSAKIFSHGDPQIRKYENGKFWQVMKIENEPFLVTVSSTGTLDKPKLMVEFASSKEVLKLSKAKIKKAIKYFFNLDFDLNRFYEDVQKDNIMKFITERLRGLKSTTTQTVFEALVDSIIEQQISLKVAHIIEKKLVRKFGDALGIGIETYYSYPTPQKLARVDVEELRKAGLTQRKAEYLKEISTLVSEGQLELEKLKSHKKPAEILNELDEVRGIGVWTAELTMVRGMKKLDTMPSDDIGLRRAISHYYCNDKKITSMQARQVAARWGEWKGLASYYLIVAEIMKIEFYPSSPD